MKFIKAISLATFAFAGIGECQPSQTSWPCLAAVKAMASTLRGEATDFNKETFPNSANELAGSVATCGEILGRSAELSEEDIGAFEDQMVGIKREIVSLQDPLKGSKGSVETAGACAIVNKSLYGILDAFFRVIPVIGTKIGSSAVVTTEEILKLLSDSDSEFDEAYCKNAGTQ
ncbi:hypothetical protein RJ55_02101 [Drechmeria coniospora]|nr:hypothetical protein RJ55_02101 [Drechmeria coniospora]